VHRTGSEPVSCVRDIDLPQQILWQWVCITQTRGVGFILDAAAVFKLMALGRFVHFLTCRMRCTRYLILSQYCAVATYELSRTSPLWTTVTGRPYKLQCHVLAMYIGAAVYWLCVTVINCPAFSMLIICVCGVWQSSDSAGSQSSSREAWMSSAGPFTRLPAPPHVSSDVSITLCNLTFWTFVMTHCDVQYGIANMQLLLCLHAHLKLLKHPNSP